jgi:hypothetical protein
MIREKDLTDNAQIVWRGCWLNKALNLRPGAVRLPLPHKASRPY